MLRSLIAMLALALLLGAAATPVWAVEPSEILADPVLERRARAISQKLRCLVCQNQSIDESNADLARDLRVIVRQRLVAGDSDAQTIGYIVARYGDWVLLKPPFKPYTWALWLGPFGIAGIAALMFGGFYRRRRPFEDGAAYPLADAERKYLEEALREE